MRIDVWPLDFFRPNITGRDRFDATCLFVLQLACVLHMSAEWKNKTVVRVFTCAKSEGEDADSKLAFNEMSRFLRDLRIRGEIKTVSWDQLPERFRRESVNSEGSEEGGHDRRAYEDQGRRGAPLPRVTDEYLQSVSELIRSQCSNTAVVFLYLPRPPVISASSQGANSEEGACGGAAPHTDGARSAPGLENYLRQLDLMTANLPPTILVHGVQPVTCTAL